MRGFRPFLPASGTALWCLIALVMATAAPPARAQLGGSPVVTGPGPRWLRTVFSDGAGGVSLAYIEDHRLFLASVRTHGTLDHAWPGGLLLATGPTGFWFPTVRPGRENDLFLAWMDDSMRVQRVIVGGDGVAPGWPPAGRALCTHVPPFYQYGSPQLGIDGNNTAWLFWDTNFEQGNVVSRAGVQDDATVVQPCQNTSCGEGQFAYGLIESGGQVVQSYATLGYVGGEPAQDVVAQWAPANVSHRPGEWVYPGTCLRPGASQAGPTLAPSTGGDIIMAFGSPALGVTAQRLAAAPVSFYGGEVWTPGGVALLSVPATAVRGISNGAGRAFFLFHAISGPTHTLIVQAIDDDGSIPAGWPSSGVVLDQVDLNIEPGEIADDGAGGVIVGWTRRSGNDRSLHGHHVLAGGSADPLWTADGVEIATMPGAKSTPAVVRDGAGGAFFAWTDYRDGNQDLYVQRITHQGKVVPTVGVEPVTPTTLALSPGHPNPTRGSIAFSLELPRDDRVLARVFDVTGRVVARIVDRWSPAGSLRLAWDGRDQDGSIAPAGVYLLEVRSGAGTRVARIVRLRPSGS